MHIILVRHGEAKRGVGDERLRDFGLTAIGREQAKSLGRYLVARDVQIDTVMCSPLPRTRETTKILVDTAGLTSPKIETGLCEM